MDIVIKVIPHEKQRYATVGDWYFNEDCTRLLIFVSDLGSWKYNYLVAYHEQIEALLCFDRGFNEKEITDFDLEYEKNRKEGNISEPGDDPKSPYRKEHFFATSAERLLAAELGVDWAEYDKAVWSL